MMTYGCLSLCGWTSLLQARTPVGREGHLGMKIRYPMECFNRKKMSILRMSVFPWKFVIMQQDVWWGTGCVNVCLHAILTVCESACDWAADCVAYSIVIHAWSVQVCIPTGCAYCIPHKVTYPYSYSGQIYTSNQYAHFLMMLQCCGWW